MSDIEQNQTFYEFIKVGFVELQFAEIFQTKGNVSQSIRSEVIVSEDIWGEGGIFPTPFEQNNWV